MKVLAISSYGVLGGAELAMATFLEGRPAEVQAQVLVVSGGPLEERIASLGVGVLVASGYRGKPGPPELGRFTRSLSGLLRRTRPDVVWAVGAKAALLAVPATRALRVPLIWHKVDFSWDRPLAQPLGVAVDGVISCSHAAAAALGALRGPRLVGVVPPPVRLPEELAPPPNGSPPAIGTLARLHPYKGHDHIIRAAALLIEEFPDLRVIFAGAPVAEHPAYPEELSRLAAELGIGDRLELRGFVDDVAAVLRQLTVFVSATYRDEQGFGLEAFGAAIAEASWVGVPVVVASGGGVAEAMVDGETGSLVAGADPALLATATSGYLRDREHARRTGEAGRRFARAEFGAQRLVPRFFSLLAGVVRRQRASSSS